MDMAPLEDKIETAIMAKVEAELKIANDRIEGLDHALESLSKSMEAFEDRTKETDIRYNRDLALVHDQDISRSDKVDLTDKSNLNGVDECLKRYVFEHVSEPISARLEHTKNKLDALINSVDRIDNKVDRVDCKVDRYDNKGVLDIKTEKVSQKVDIEYKIGKNSESFEKTNLQITERRGLHNEEQISVVRTFEKINRVLIALLRKFTCGYEGSVSSIDTQRVMIFTVSLGNGNEQGISQDAKMDPSCAQPRW
ncbi:uncharacterized protein L201_001736 [Kwoniella dendrophila CBS 6074]|uniref:t-SNARE coiled-coil homology domain-containing protein n=1 Tax=Kwoniella dendrophila CBS 6074 TaxID=1295534 RepID=A0AAX4JN70_9TREE